MDARVVTDVVELGVGVACLIGVPAAWRSSRVRWLAPVLAIAGLAAAIHAITSLAA
jgi:hypothetical protein